MLPSSTSTWNPPISFEEVAECFTLPIVEASAKLGICSTTLKRMCREHGIPRWPYRKVMAGKSIEEIKREAVGQQAAEDGYVGGNSFMVGSYEHEELSRVKNPSEDGRWKGVQHIASSNALWSPAAPNSMHGRSTRDCLPDQSAAQGHSVAAAWRPGSGGETPLDKAKGASIDSSIQHPAGLPLLYPSQGTMPGLSLPFPSGPPHVGSSYFPSTFSNYEIPATSSSTPFDGARSSPLGLGNNHLSVGYPQSGMPRLTYKWWRKSNAGRKNLQDVKERVSSEGAGRPGETTESQPQDREGGGGGGARGGDREPDSSSEVAKSASTGQRKDSSSLRASHMAASLWRKRKERAASQARKRDSKLAVYRGYGQPLREGDLDVLKLVFGKFVSTDWEDLGARRVISEQ